MATYYVDSSATGLNDGSSWTDAWTSITSALSVAAGDTVLVSSTHSETPTTSNMHWSNSTTLDPIKIINVDKTTNQYTTASKAEYNIRTNNQFAVLYVKGDGLRVYGLKFIGGTGIECPGYDFHYTDCEFYVGANSGRFSLFGGLEGHNGVFENCLIENQISSQILAGGNSRIIFRNCDIHSTSSSTTKTILSHGASSNWGLGSSVEFHSCVFDCKYIYSGRTDHTSKGHELDALFVDCEFPASYEYYDSAYTFTSVRNIVISNSSSGSNGEEINYVSGKHSEKGSTKGVSTVYRTSGANAGSSGFSWELTSSSNSIEQYRALRSIPITKWVESGSQTITVYVAGSSSLNDDDFWIEVDSPSEEVSPTAQGKFRTTKPEPLATPTALTSDTSSTWNGTGVGTKQKIEVAISPTIAGTVTVRCYLAKPSTTVYVDPKISSDGYQYVYQGVLVDGYPVVSATTPPSSATFSQIIDNGGVGYSLIGSWLTYSGSVPGKYGGDYNYISGGTGSNVATWSFTGLRRGMYQVSVSWAYNGSHTTSANYKAYSGNSLQVNQTKNQTISAASDYVENGIPFENLGGTFVVSGGSLTVTLDDSQASGFAIADAVRIELVSEIESESGTQIFPFRQWVEDKAIAGTTTPLTPVHPLRSN